MRRPQLETRIESDLSGRQAVGDVLTRSHRPARDESENGCRFGESFIRPARLEAEPGIGGIHRRHGRPYRAEKRQPTGPVEETRPQGRGRNPGTLAAPRTHPAPLNGQRRPGRRRAEPPTRAVYGRDRRNAAVITAELKNTSPRERRRPANLRAPRRPAAPPARHPAKRHDHDSQRTGNPPAPLSTNHAQNPIMNSAYDEPHHRWPLDESFRAMNDTAPMLGRRPNGAEAPVPEPIRRNGQHGSRPAPVAARTRFRSDGSTRY